MSVSRNAGGWAARVVDMARSAQARLPSVGWAGLSDGEAGALPMALRAGPVEAFMSGLSPVERQGRPLFPIMLMQASDGRPCRLELEGFLAGGETLRMAAFPEGAGRDPLWEELVGLAEMGAPGWLGDGDDGWPKIPVTRRGLEACAEVEGLDPERVGAAFLPLRRGAPVLGIDAALLMCAALDVRDRMARMNVGMLRMSLRGAGDGRRGWGDVTGCAWAGAVPLPVESGEGGEAMAPEDVGKPGACLDAVHLSLESRGGEMRATGVEFTGRMVH